MAQASTALLVMDVQPGVVERVADKEAYLERIKRVVAGAKSHGLPVLYIVVGFRAGMPEVSPANKSFSAIKSNDTVHLIDPRPVFDLEPDDIVIYKRRVSAFAGSDLEVILSGLQINHLVLTGIATSGVVLSTLRAAADKDYQLTVLADACADTDEEVHRVLTEKVFPRQAEVLTSDDWLATL